MYILIHTRIRGLQTDIRRKQPTQGNTRLDARISPIVNIEQAKPKSGIQTESIGDRPIILCVGSKFMRPQPIIGKSLGDLHGIRQAIVQCHHPVILRSKIMYQIIAAETDMMRRHWLIIERSPDTEIRNSRHIRRLIQRMLISGISVLT